MFMSGSFPFFEFLFDGFLILSFPLFFCLFLFWMINLFSLFLFLVFLRTRKQWFLLQEFSLFKFSSLFIKTPQFLLVEEALDRGFVLLLPQFGRFFLRWELSVKPPANDLYSKFDSIKGSITWFSKEACNTVSFRMKRSQRRCPRRKILSAEKCMGSFPQPWSIESPRSSESHGGCELGRFFHFQLHPWFLFGREWDKKNRKKGHSLSLLYLPSSLSSQNRSKQLDQPHEQLVGPE